MKHCFIWLASLVVTCILRLRYRITYKGFGAVKKALKGSTKGCLFLPNHPTIDIDPLIACLPLVRSFPIRPLIVEYMYYKPLLNKLFRLFSALPIPNFTTGFNSLKLERTEHLLQSISTGLKKGECFLVYPAGTTRHISKEMIGGAFGVHQLISENPEIDIVLIRTTGLWGSSFSRAMTSGALPDINVAIKQGFWSCLKNCIFFMPKRDVLVEFELAGSEFPRKASKNEMNRYFEYWYNKPFGPQGEPLNLVPYNFWNKESVLSMKGQHEPPNRSHTPQEVKDKIVSKVAELAKLSPLQISPHLRLLEDLGLDSLNLAELISFLEAEFNVSGIIPQDIITVDSLFLNVTEKGIQKPLSESQWNLTQWMKTKPKKKISMPKAKTLTEAFLKACDSHLFDTASADPARGPITYYTLKQRALNVCKMIQNMKWTRIGILLPASNPSQMLLLACQMAGCTVVMLNWRKGKEALEAQIQETQIDRVLTSWIFVDNLKNVDLSGIDSKLVMLEELSLQLKMIQFLKNIFLTILPSCSHWMRFDTQKSEVILYTEANPNGVSITQEYMLSSMCTFLKTAMLYEDDRVLSIVFPCTYFGLIYSGIFPILSGLRVVYYPNPRDSARLAKAIPLWKITVICATVDCIKNIFLSAETKQLSTIRQIIITEEKPDELFLSLLNSLAPQAELVQFSEAQENI